MSLRKAVRSLQVFFPFIQQARFVAHLYFNRLSNRVLERDFLALSLFDWPADAVFLDIGANRGFAIEAMRAIVPHAYIESFEPNPNMSKRLQRFYKNTPRLRLHPIGLGDHELESTLWVPVYRQWEFDGLGSLDRAEAYHWLNSERLYFFNERHLQLRQYTCTIRRLDDLGLAPAFIKIDVQGFELQVLRGAEATLNRARPLLMIANPDSAAEVAFLKTNGYTICAYENGRLLPGRAGKINSFFLTDRHLQHVA